MSFSGLFHDLLTLTWRLRAVFRHLSRHTFHYFRTSSSNSVAQTSISTCQLEISTSPGTVLQACNPSTRETEAGEPALQGQPGLHETVSDKTKPSLWISSVSITNSACSYWFWFSSAPSFVWISPKADSNKSSSGSLGTQKRWVGWFAKVARAVFSIFGPLLDSEMSAFLPLSSGSVCHPGLEPVACFDEKWL